MALRFYPSIKGTDIKTKMEVHQPGGIIEGTVAYRVADGRDQRPRIGVRVDGPLWKGKAPAINGRVVRNICVDAKSLTIGPRPEAEVKAMLKKAAEADEPADEATDSK